METLKIGMREFRENLASYLESDTPLAITRRGETLGFYIPAHKRDRGAELARLSHLKAVFTVGAGEFRLLSTTVLVKQAR